MHALIAAAAEGELPEWARVSGERREHLARVAGLMGQWADELGLGSNERMRWQAAGWLHDALRDADHELLRGGVPAALHDLPAKLLHGPAAAERLEREGVTDEDLVRAVGFHTLGHPDFGRLGRALYLADYLEPGREHDDDHAAALRGRLPEAMDQVIREVAAERLGRFLARGLPLRPETVEFWNALAGNG